MAKSLLSPYRRICNVMKFYALRGLNSERVNLVYRKIVGIRFGGTE